MTTVRCNRLSLQPLSIKKPSAKNTIRLDPGGGFTSETAARRFQK
jgi:hypothetical protein